MLILAEVSAYVTFFICRDWYNPAAVFLNPSLSDRLVSSLYDLSSMEFDLPVKGINLEETWPSFVQ